MEAKYRRDTFKYYKKYNSKRTALVNLPIIPVIIPQYIDYH